MSSEISVPCSYCGQILHRSPCEVAAHKCFFCNRRCKGKWQSEHTTGENGSNWRGGMAVRNAKRRAAYQPKPQPEPRRCVVCGREFRPSIYSPAAKICGPKCRAAMGARGKVPVACATCGTILYRFPSRLKANQNNYCSMECRDAKRRKTPLICPHSGREFSPVEYRACTGCGAILPATPEFFFRSGDGLRADCKQCKRDQQAQWRRDNIERAREYARMRYREPEHRVHATMSAVMNQSLANGKNGAAWEGLVGYTTKELMRHLAAQFADGMTWQNHGLRGWHIDHIRPISSFTITSPDDPEFKQCWALSNLRPLWAEENLRKRATWEGGVAA